MLTKAISDRVWQVYKWLESKKQKILKSEFLGKIPWGSNIKWLFCVKIDGLLMEKLKHILFD